jgi:glucose/mannose-6-phosphate isomerase
MKTLDDASRTKRLDSQGMLGVLDGYVDGFLQAYRAASHARLAAPAGLGNVLICGMGGSGIGGNLVAGLIRPECPVPLTILKDYQVPGAVGPKSLVIAVSYSGNTEETLTVALEARARGATLVGVSSGGQLMKLAKERGSAYLPVEAGFAPRAALPHLFGTLLGAANALRLATLAPDAGLASHLRRVHAGLKPDVPERSNPAKQWARELHVRLPVWYGAGPLAPVALRARCQLNENAKMISRNDELPEANHNELVAWNSVKRGGGYFVGLLRQPDEPKEIARRFEFVETVLARRKVPRRTFTATAPTPLGRVLETLLFVDYVSVYAAFLRGVDPTPVDVIGALKDVLGKSGRAPEIRKRLR